jgi:hypothetical protein
MLTVGASIAEYSLDLHSVELVERDEELLRQGV